MKIHIIHGWAYDISPWHEVAAHLKEHGVTAELLQVPGLTAPSKKAWTIKEYATWADQHIPNGAFALGHSNGGRILMNLLSEKPRKLKGLILLDSAGVYRKPTLKNRAFYIGAKALAPLKPIKPLRRLVHKFIGASDYERAPENMKKTLNNMLTSDQKLDPSSIIVPTRIIWGAKDLTTPLKDGEELHRLIKGSKLHVESDWGHSPYFKHPKALAALIAKSLKDLAS